MIKVGKYRYIKKPNTQDWDNTIEANKKNYRTYYPSDINNTSNISDEEWDIKLDANKRNKW